MNDNDITILSESQKQFREVRLLLSETINHLMQYGINGLAYNVGFYNQTGLVVIERAKLLGMSDSDVSRLEKITQIATEKRTFLLKKTKESLEQLAQQLVSAVNGAPILELGIEPDKTLFIQTKQAIDEVHLISRQAGTEALTINESLIREVSNQRIALGKAEHEKRKADLVAYLDDFEKKLNKSLLDAVASLDRLNPESTELEKLLPQWIERQLSILSNIAKLI